MNSSIADPLEISFTLNILSRTLTVTTLKIWQRRVAAEACLETFERQKEATIDKLDYALEAFKRIAPKVLREYAHIAPFNLTADQLCRETLPTPKNPTPTLVTGTTIWKTTWWEKMNTYIANKMIPMWLSVRPKLKDGSVPSGVQNFEPALELLRKKLFDDEYNSVSVVLKQKIADNNNKKQPI